MGTDIGTDIGTDMDMGMGIAMESGAGTNADLRSGRSESGNRQATSVELHSWKWHPGQRQGPRGVKDPRVRVRVRGSIRVWIMS